VIKLDCQCFMLRKPKKVNAMHNKKYFPIVEVLDELFCPHCGVKLITFEEGLLASCPHLVFVYSWDEDGVRFDMVRPDYGQSFMETLIGTTEYQVLLQFMIGPLSASDQEKFMQGIVSPRDKTGKTVAGYCIRFPEKLFPELLSSETVIFMISHYYGGTYIVIDFGP
jgi:hypothetical protein